MRNTVRKGFESWHDIEERTFDAIGENELYNNNNVHNNMS